MRPPLLPLTLLAVLATAEASSGPAKHGRLTPTLSGSNELSGAHSATPPPTRSSNYISPEQGQSALVMITLFGVAAARASDEKSLYHILTKSISSLLDVAPIYHYCTDLLRNTPAATHTEPPFLPKHFFGYMCSTVTRSYAEKRIDDDPFAKTILQANIPVFHIEGANANPSTLRSARIDSVGVHSDDVSRSSGVPFTPSHLRPILALFIDKMTLFPFPRPLGEFNSASRIHGQDDSGFIGKDDVHNFAAVLSQEKTQILRDVLSSFVNLFEDPYALITALHLLLPPSTSKPARKAAKGGADIVATTYNPILAINDAVDGLTLRLSDRLDLEAKEKSETATLAKKAHDILKERQPRTRKPWTPSKKRNISLSKDRADSKPAAIDLPSLRLMTGMTAASISHETAFIITTMIVLFGIASIYALSVGDLHSNLREVVVPKVADDFLDTYCPPFPKISLADRLLLPSGFIEYMCSISTQNRQTSLRHGPDAILAIEGASRSSKPLAPPDLPPKSLFFDKINLALSIERFPPASLRSPSVSLRDNLRPILVKFIKTMTTFKRNPTATKAIKVQHEKIVALGKVVSILLSLVSDRRHLAIAIQNALNDNDKGFVFQSQTAAAYILEETIAEFSDAIGTIPDASHATRPSSSTAPTPTPSHSSPERVPLGRDYDASSPNPRPIPMGSEKLVETAKLDRTSFKPEAETVKTVSRSKVDTTRLPINSSPTYYQKTPTTSLIRPEKPHFTRRKLSPRRNAPRPSPSINNTPISPDSNENIVDFPSILRNTQRPNIAWKN